MKNLRSLIIGACLTLGLTAFAQTAAKTEKIQASDGMVAIPTATALPATDMPFLAFEADKTLENGQLANALIFSNEKLSFTEAVKTFNQSSGAKNVAYKELSAAEGNAFLSKNDAAIKERLQKLGDKAKIYTAMAIVRTMQQTAQKLADNTATPATANGGSSGGGGR